MGEGDNNENGETVDEQIGKDKQEAEETKSNFLWDFLEGNTRPSEENDDEPDIDDDTTDEPDDDDTTDSTETGNDEGDTTDGGDKKSEDEPNSEPNSEPNKKPKSRPKVTSRKPAPTTQPALTQKELVDALREANKPPAAPTEPDPTANQYEGLDDIEIDEIEIAKFAEGKDPKHKGLASSLEKFFRASREQIAKRAADSGDDDYDPQQDRDYQAWVAKNRPAFNPVERRKMEREMIKAQAGEELRKEMGSKFEQIERRARELELKPQIEKRVNEFRTRVFEGMPEELVEEFKTNGGDMEKLKEKFIVEAPIVLDMMNVATTLANEYLGLKRGVIEWQPDKRPTQTQVVRFIDEQGDEMLRKGGRLLTRDGKQFVHPSKHDPKDESTWTFSEDDIVEMLRLRAIQEAKTRIEKKNAEYDRVAEYRKTKGKPSPSAPNGGNREPDPSSAASTSSNPSKTKGAKPSDGAPKSSGLIKILGM